MKAIIDGKVYNTETAECIGTHWNGCSTSDFDYLSEGLYVTKKGAYFVSGEGGARSKYAVSYGSNSVGGGERIVPLTKEEAFEWAQEHLAPEDIEEHFGDLIEEA